MDTEFGTVVAQPELELDKRDRLDAIEREKSNVLSEGVDTSGRGNELFVRLSKEDLDYFTVNFHDYKGGVSRGGGAANALAEQIATEIAIDDPQFSYDLLKSGRTTLWDDDPESKQLFQNGMTDEQILKLLVKDIDGNRIKDKNAFSGMKRGIAPGLGMSGGARVGLQAGLALQAPIPPVSPLSVAAKVIIPTVTTLTGMFLGESAATSAQDVVLGDETPVLPSDRASVEAGRTGAIILSSGLSLPAAIPKTVELGSSAFMVNLNNMRKKLEVAPVGPPTKEVARSTLYRQAINKKDGLGAKLKQRKTAGGLDYTKLDYKDPFSIRFNRGAENFLKDYKKDATGSLKGAGANAYREAKFAAGAGFGTVLAEGKDPGNELLRAGSEIALGTASSMIGLPVAIAVNLYPTVKRALLLKKDRFTVEGRKRNEVRKIFELLEETGEDVPALVELLESMDFDKLFKDVNETAGLKTGSPLFIALENSLTQTGSDIGQVRNKAAEQSKKLLLSAINELSGSGNPDDLQRAAGLAKEIFEAGHVEQISQVTNKVLSAFEQVKGTDSESNIELSKQLYQVVSDSLWAARQRETQLWKSIPNVTQPYVIDGVEDSVPIFIRDYDSFFTQTKDYNATEKLELGDIHRFVERKRKEFGLNGDKDAEGNLIGPIDGASLSTQELIDTRSKALALQRKLMGVAAPDREAAGRAGMIAQSILETLEDMQGINRNGMFTDNLALYNVAKSFSRSVNDTWTRAFGGKVKTKDATGAQKVPPELLGRALFVGGNDPTFLRLGQLEDIGKFVIREGVDEGESISNTIKGVNVQLLRNARAASFDPKTGKVSRKNLDKWIANNEDTLNMYPRLRDDLNNATLADDALSEANINIKSQNDDLKNQISFLDVMKSNGGPQGTENPTSAIALALSKGETNPVQQLNRILKMIDSSGLEGAKKEEALAGFKTSILEWAEIKAGGSAKTVDGAIPFSSVSYARSLFDPIPGSKGKISLVEYMVEKGVMPADQRANLKMFMDKMIRLEAANANGTFGDIVETMGAVGDLSATILGSGLATKASKITGFGSDAGSIAISARGAKMMRDLFNELPGSAKLDVMTEVMKNPKMLAGMLRNVKSDTEKVRLAKVLRKQFVEAGLLSGVRRTVPLIIQDTEVEEPVAPVQKRPQPQPEQAREAQEVTQLQGPMPPPTPAPAPVAPPTAPNTGPVDRSRFAAMFPNDIASGLINQGIGSIPA